MKPSKLIILFFVFAILGGLGLLVFKSSLPDHEKITQDVTQRLLLIDGLDSSISEFALRSRYNLEHNYDSLAKATVLLEKEIVELRSAYFNDNEFKGSLLKKKFDEYEIELEIKKDLIETFKSHNSVLRNSEKYAPAVGQELMAIAERENLIEVSPLYNDLVKNLLEYSLLGSSSSAEKIKAIKPRLEEAEKQMPEYALTAVIEFTNHVNTVIQEKEITDSYLNKALTSTSNESLDALSQAWNEWSISKKETMNNLYIYVVIYILFLIFSVSFITWKLIKLYQTLDEKVEIRTEEAKKAFEDLKESETQLIQTEKMASLGQLVAGVAHEINTPLGYISNNVSLVQSSVAGLTSLLVPIKGVKNILTGKDKDKKNLSPLIKTMVKEYMRLEKEGVFVDLPSLLEDSTYGLDEISELVSSLKDFSRLDRANVAEADIHGGLDATLKICSNEIGQRKLVKEYSEQIPLIECMPAQINQVFMNVLNNAAQATDPTTGVITITTEAMNGGIQISIKDNGMGMSDETMKSIFDPFYTTKEIGKGTGLGMSISYKIIKAHGGSVVVESVEGKGTEVIIKLPIDQAVPELSIIR